MATSFKKSHACTAALSAPNLAAGHLRSMPPLYTPGHSRACLDQSLMGFFSGSWCTHGFVCALQESVSPVLCKFWWLYGRVNGDLLQEGLCHTQVYCTQSPCPCNSALLTRTFSGDTQTVLSQSLWGHCSFLLGPGANKILFVPFKSLYPQSCVNFGGSRVG